MSDLPLSTFDRLKLMVWKNWNIHMYHRKQIFFCAVTPFIFSLILIVMRFLIVVDNLATVKYTPIVLDDAWGNAVAAFRARYTLKPVEYSIFIPRIGVAYAPNGTAYANAIMKEAAAKYLGNVDLYSFKTQKDMVAAVKLQNYIAGVFFQSHNNRYHTAADDTKYPQNLVYSLTFPRELRFYQDSFIGASWQTNQLFDNFNRARQRYPNANDGGFVGYIREGFASLQNAIALSYMQLLNTTVFMPKIEIQRFPHIAQTSDPMADSLVAILSCVILVGFWFPCMNLIMFITTEIETQRMTYIKTMGISYGTQIAAWFINAFLILFVASTLVVFSLKVHFVEGFAVCSKSSWTVLIYIMAAYIMATFSFSFMICSFFDHSLASMVFMGLMWMLTYMPFVLINTNRASTTVKVALSLLPNSAMGLILHDLIEFEEFEDGFNWSTYFDTRSIDNKLSIGIITLILFFMCIPYTLVGLYVHRTQAFLSYFHIRCKRWFRRERNRRSTEAYMTHRRMTKVYEVNPESKSISVQVIKMTKSIRDQLLIHKMSLNLYEDEITVIMGHNGCGKTLLLSMIGGFTKFSHGTAIIRGYDLRKNPNRAYANIGSSFQQTNLIPELTVFSQVSFHCRLKGLYGESLRNELQKYLSSSNLEDKVNTYTSRLNLSTKQYLSVCCALSGGSSFVMLDQPTNGMEATSRKQLWDLLISEKVSRTILITTHSIEEADCLADRVAIMAGGELKCFGSSFFLRNIYASGSRLILIKKEHCDTNAVTEALQQFIPGISPDCEIGFELSYKLEDRYRDVYSKILAELEQRSFELRINSITIREASLSDIFMGMGSHDQSHGENLRYTDVMNGRTIHDNPNNFKYLEKSQKCTGFLLVFNQFQAIFYKRLMLNYHLKAVPLMMLFMPLLFITISFVFSKSNVSEHTNEPMTFRLRQYPESVTVLMVQPKLNDIFCEDVAYKYRELISRKGLDHKLVSPENKLFSDFILDLQSTERDQVYNKYIVGATVKFRKLTAWFNNFPLHTVPLSLNVLHNAMLNAVVMDPNYRITVIHTPLPHAAAYHTDDMRAPASIGNALAENLTYCISIVWTISISYMVDERVKRSALLQYICGARASVRWLTNYFYDCLCISIGSLLILITILGFRQINFMHADLAMYFFPTLIFFGMCILPFYYMVSHLFNNAILSYLVICTFNIYGGVTFTTFMGALEREYTHTLKVDESLLWCFRIFPHFSLVNMLLKIFTVGKVRHLCSDRNLYRVSVDLEKCTVLPNCCYKPEELSWTGLGILPELASFLAFGIGSTILLILLELHKLNKLSLSRKIPADNMEHARDDHARWHQDNSEIDDSVYTEQARVNSLKPRDYLKKPLVLKCFGKTQKHTVIAQRMFLIIDRCECACFISTDRINKRLPFEVLIGQNKMSYGRAYINGASLSDNLYQVYQHCSYSPKVDALENNLSAAEHMRIHALLRGIPRDEMSPICEGLAKILGFITHYKKPMQYLSEGYKRRVSIATSMLGNPSIIFMEEPTTPLDLASQRQVWYLIGKTRNSGTAVLMSSTNMREYQRICTRVGVVFNGRIQYIDHPDEFNRKFSKGYLLKIKMKLITTIADNSSDSDEGSNEAIFTPNPYLRVQSFVETEFNNSSMKDQRGNLLYFVIPFIDAELSEIFTIVQENTFNLNIETFSVSSATLSMILMDLAERERTITADGVL